MGARGPLRKPDNVLEMSGVANKETRERDAKERKALEKAAERDKRGLPFLEDVPKPPPWLTNSHAQAEWKRLIPALVRCQILTEANLHTFTQMCNLHGKMVQLWAAGEVPPMNMLAMYRTIVSEFGFTPLSQSRIKAGIMADYLREEKANAFSRNGRDENDDEEVDRRRTRKQA